MIALFLENNISVLIITFAVALTMVVSSRFLSKYVFYGAERMTKNATEVIKLLYNGVCTVAHEENQGPKFGVVTKTIKEANDKNEQVGSQRVVLINIQEGVKK